MKKQHTRIYTLAACFFLCSCSGVRPVIKEGLTLEQANAVDQLVDMLIPFDEIIFQDGSRLNQFISNTELREGNNNGVLFLTDPAVEPNQRRKTIIAAMLRRAYELMDRSKWQIASDGPDGPKQNGLAYLYGQKDPNVRAKPSEGSCTMYRIKGLDCSGFVYQCAQAANLPLPTGPANLQDQAQTWRKLFPEPWKLGADPVKNGKYDTGDIISWGSHIGILALDSNNNIAVLQSHGKEKPEAQCSKNLELTRGPRSISLSEAIRPNWFGPNFSVLRIQPIQPVTPSSCYQILKQGVDQTLESCEDFFNYTPDELIPLKTICNSFGGVEGRLQATFSSVACPRTRAYGGCKQIRDGKPHISWFYIPVPENNFPTSAQKEILRSSCGTNFVEP